MRSCGVDRSGVGGSAVRLGRVAGGGMCVGGEGGGRDTTCCGSLLQSPASRGQGVEDKCRTLWRDND